MRFERTAALCGSLAGLFGGVVTALLLVPRALLHGLQAEAGFQARATLVGSHGSLAGIALQLCCAALVGGLFGWRSGIRSGLELAMRGIGLGFALWILGRLLWPLAAPGLWADPMAPSLAEYLIFGGLLGLQARLCRWMLMRRWRRAEVGRRLRVPAPRPATTRTKDQPSHA